ncbi:MAG: RsmD family RNA methyltransferase [Prolixibacteraceae bacterium]|nr:RsmD family RNA methyltransferase [Prolixibacteraceae bacterium]
MRIISGIYGGRRIDTGKKFKARPTTDMAKESLFNILQNRIDFGDIKVLDLFSGTGSISFEFASRGCTDITSVESNYQHYLIIRETIKKFGDNHIKSLKGDAFSFIRKTSDHFDLIFADPPYDLPDFDKIPGLILGCRLLNEKGLLIIEHPDKYNFSDFPEFTEERNYGKVHFSFFENKATKQNK